MDLLRVCVHRCDPAVSILKGFNEEIAITSDSLNRLSNLERRLTMTSTPNAGSHPNATSSSSQRSGPGSSGFGSNVSWLSIFFFIRIY